MRFSLSARIAGFFASASLMIGCSVTPSGNPSTNVPVTTNPTGSAALTGHVHGGQWPLKYSHVYLLGASQRIPSGGDSGYGDRSSGLITTSAFQDTNATDPTYLWYYVETGDNGNFTIPDGTYACTPGQEVYLYSVNGDGADQSGDANPNSAAGLMAILGECGAGNSISGVPALIQINEITTVAAAYAFAGFATDATHISSPISGQGYQAIRNAVQNAAILADISTGDVQQNNPVTTVVPGAMIYTIADILAACINSQNSSTAACTRLMGDETFNSVAPTDTASAAINMAHHPGAHVADIYNNMLTDQVWGGYITGGPPTDFAIGVGFSGGGLTSPLAIAIDAGGNAWVTDTPSGGFGNGAVIVLGPQGTVMSGASGYTCGLALGLPVAMALGPSTLTPETAWVVSAFTRTVDGVPNGGGTCTSIKSPEDHTDLNGWSQPISIAAGNDLVVVDQGLNDVDEFSLGSNSSATWTANWQGIFINPDVVALDGAGDIWVADESTIDTTANIYALNSTNNYVALSNAPLGTSQDYMAVGANQSLWVADLGNDDAIPFATSVTINSASATAGTPFTDPTGGIGNPDAIAVDGIGNAWVLNAGGAVIAAFSADGTTALSPDGTAANTAPFGGYSGNGIMMPSSSYPTGIAVDPSGDVWVSVESGNAPVVEFIGMASPTVTPLADAVVNNKIAKLP